MGAAISWGLCDADPTLVELLQRLSLCESTVDRAAALVLGGMAADATTRALSELVNRSLLNGCFDHQGSVSYEVGATVRAWGRSTLATDPMRANRIRVEHTNRMVQLADAVGSEVRGRGQGQPLPPTAIQHAGDFVAVIGVLMTQGRADRALVMAADLEDVWIQLGYLSEVERILSELLVTGTEDVPNTLRRNQCELLGRWSLRTGRIQRAVELLTEAASCSRRVGDRNAELRVVLPLGEALGRSGRRGDAESLLRLAAEHAAGDPATDSEAIDIALSLLALPFPATGEDTEWEDLQRRIKQLEPGSCGLAARNALAESQLGVATVNRALRLYRDALDSPWARWHPLEAIGAVEGCAAAYLVAGDDYVRVAATVTLAARQLRDRHGVPQRDAAGQDIEWREKLGVEVLGELEQTVSKMDLPEVIDYLSAAPMPQEVADSGLGELTPRQREIAELVATGMTNRMIASHLGLSEWTIVNHLRQVMAKLDCPSRLHVALVVGRGSKTTAAAEDAVAAGSSLRTGDSMVPADR
ncbi:LuxR C-terminal-related transcriptional regulator [Nocardia halotolerans]|uniref:LuxR C-terminal-related transcriptional regulator n=1 Tax=Nocardia halotolerans TaxID=1755878 RepID=A0ABV8VKJ1_9NOCA